MTIIVLCTWVKELLEDGGLKWNEDMLRLCFNEWEIEAIKGNKVPVHSNEDILTWHYTKNGLYSVRSDYFFELQANEEEGTSSREADKGLWMSS